MSTVASVRIDQWGNNFVVVGEFQNMTAVIPREFRTYQEALAEMVKIAAREQLRYESGLRDSFGR